MVSICCVTYNHADTIAETLESFLRQTEPFEVLVHDDASDDGTQDIIADYARRFPDVIFPLYEKENQYSRGVSMDATFNFPRAKGEYLALCEGDDCWTDDGKLAKQVAAMQADEGRTFCFTNAMVHDVSGKEKDRLFLPYYAEDAALVGEQTRDFGLGEVARLTFLPTASFLFSRSALESVPRELLLKACPNGDLRMKLMFTAVGKACYLPDVTCVYRLNAGSSAMARWGNEAAERTRTRCRQVLGMLEDVERMSGGQAEAELRALKEMQWRVMLCTAPQRDMVKDEMGRRVYQALPLKQKAKIMAKLMLKR